MKRLLTTHLYFRDKENYDLIDTYFRTTIYVTVCAFLDSLIDEHKSSTLLKKKYSVNVFFLAHFFSDRKKWYSVSTKKINFVTRMFIITTYA